MFEMNLSEANFAVRIIDETTNVVLDERSVTTTTGAVAPGGFTPGFAELTQFVNPGQTAPVREHHEQRIAANHTRDATIVSPYRWPKAAT